MITYLHYFGFLGKDSWSALIKLGKIYVSLLNPMVVRVMTRILFHQNGKLNISENSNKVMKLYLTAVAITWSLKKVL